jgi:hypothetical protein
MLKTAASQKIVSTFSLARHLYQKLKEQYKFPGDDLYIFSFFIFYLHKVGKCDKACFNF